MTIDWTTELVEQLQFHWDHGVRPKLAGLTDDEYLWEPVSGMASLRPRADAHPDWRTSGSGDWVMEHPPDDGPGRGDPPMTTIAWRVAHLVLDVFALRNASHVDGREFDRDAWEWTPSAADGLAALDAQRTRWLDHVRAMSDDDLARPVGHWEGPFAEHPMAGLVLHLNREAIHHASEILLLRDLHRNRHTMKDTA